MNKVIVLFALLAIASASFLRIDSQNALWGTWKSTHNKQYSATEEPHRLAIFLQNIAKIAKLNAENDGAKFAVNKFADLTEAEFKAQYLNGGLSQPEMNTKGFINYENAGSLPDSVDWRNKGGVTPVKNQGNCGSSYTFSAVGVLEGFYFVNSGKLVSLSEQQIADCASDAGQGCNGGLPYLALEYTAKYGLESEEDYPYTATNGECKYNASKAIKVNSGYKFVTPKSSDQLKAALVNNPVAVLVEASSALQFYTSGVISTGCGANVDHTILAVGYQKVGALEGFIVKNSWGTYWGMDGYAYISTIQKFNGGKGACGILYQPFVPVL